MSQFKQNESVAARRQMNILLVDVNDGVTPIAGIVASCTIRKPGAAAYAAITGAVVEIGLGAYVINFSAADLDTIGECGLMITGVGAQTVYATMEVKDALYVGSVGGPTIVATAGPVVNWS